jgi:hypothetical protein
MSGRIWAIQIPTGTFFCDKTTAQSLPRRPTDMMFAAVIALKAYSGWRCQLGRLGPGDKMQAAELDSSVRIGLLVRDFLLTDLVQATIVGENGDMSVVCAG